MAMSLNGIIAREDGREDFLSDTGWKELVRLSTHAGCLIWGRTTYEAVRKWDPKYLQPMKDLVKVILANQSNPVLDPGFVPASSPQQALVSLSNKGFTQVILTGGSTTNSSFAKLDLIDEVMINIEPVIIGQGIPLFKPTEFIQKLELFEVKNLSPQTIQLHYRVKKSDLPLNPQLKPHKRGNY